MDIFVVVIGVAWLVLFFTVAAQIARARMDETAKAVWILAVMLVPLFGAIAWWMIGNPVKVPADDLPRSKKLS